MVYMRRYRRRDLIERFALCAERLRELRVARGCEEELSTYEHEFNLLVEGHSGDFFFGCLLTQPNPLHQIYSIEAMLADQHEVVGDLGYRPRNAAHTETLLKRWDDRFPRLRTRSYWLELMIEKLLPF